MFLRSLPTVGGSFYVVPSKKTFLRLRCGASKRF